MTSYTDWDSIQFVKNNFRAKECSRFVCVNKSTQLCGCGGTQEEHKLVETDPNVQWNEQLIHEHPTNAFGKIRFVNPSDSLYRKPAKFVRLSNDSDVKSVIQLMMHHWRMSDPSPPDLIISVFGGGKQFYLGNNRSKEIFNQGLAKAIVATKGWIFTFGCNFGVARAVGEAVRDHQRFDFDLHGRVKCSIQCVGVAPWGTVKNRNSLINSLGSHRGFNDHKYYSDRTVRPGKPTCLEPNHTHFLLVDDGHSGTDIGTAHFRAELEKEISRPKDGRQPIPVVGLLVEGGVMAVENVCQSLHHDLPVVVCEGSGRAADIIGRCYHQLSTSPSDELIKTVTQSVATKLESIQASWKDKPQLIKNLSENIVKLCVSKRHLIHVFNLARGEDLDVAILESLMNSKKLDVLGQLRLALQWNRDDIARDTILAKAESVRGHIKHKDMMPFFIDAIIRNQTQFVKLFCETGLNVSKHLTASTLRVIYQQSIAETPVLKDLLSQHGKRTGDADVKLLDIHSFLVKTTRRFDDVKYAEDKLDEDNFEKFACPYTELFIFSVITCRYDLALYFWEICDNPILNAVVGSLIANILHQLIPESESMDYSVLKCKLEELATGLLNDAYTTHVKRAEKLVRLRYKRWANLTVVDLAALANDQEFLSTACCQRSIVSYWKDNINADGFTLAICTFTLLPICYFINFNDPPSLMNPHKVSNIQTNGNQAKERESLSPVWTPPPTFEKEFELSRRRSSRINVASETLQALKPMKPLGPIQKICRFYQTPVVKFACHTFWYIVFLILYAYVLLFSFRWHITFPEIVMHICVATLLLEEFRLHFKDKLFDWWYQSSMLSWRGLDMLILLAGLLAFICRWFVSSFATAKLLLVFNFILLLLRIFRVYFANSYLGPKIVMIKRMVWDVAMFLLVFVVFLLAYTISSQSLLYPYRSFYKMIFWDIFNHGMWELFGTIQDELTGVSEQMKLPDCSSNMTISYECELRWWPVPILLATYLIFANILLVNMLIAVFTHVFEDVQKNAQQIWKYQMYFLVKEFQSKPLLPPPFIILSHLYLLFNWAISKCSKQQSCSKGEPNPRMLEMLSAFEKAIRSDFLENQLVLANGQSEILLNAISQKVTKLECSMADLEAKSNVTALN